MPVATVTAGTGIGQPVRRKEDLRLVTGKGSYTDDVNLPGQAYAVFVRSPHAHARIRAIDIAPAMTVPGVLAVLTGRDLVADGLQPIPHKVWSQHPAELTLRERDGFKTFTAPHYPLPPDKVRFVGEAVAIVVAASVPAAKDGAERVEIDYDVLPAPSHERIYFSAKYFNQLESEVLYDIGAYTGDSVEGFLGTERGAAFSQIHSFEPSPNNFVKLEQYIASRIDVRGKVFAHRLALGDGNGLIQVETEHGPASRVGTGSDTVQMTTIDDFGKSTALPTFIKIDIEGFEPKCLQGAKQTISQTAPVVAVCVYHMQSHIWDILLQLNSYRGDYAFSLCPHVADGWDLVLYAVPKHRGPV